MTTQAQDNTGSIFTNTCREDAAWFTANPHKLFRYRQMNDGEYAAFMTAFAAETGLPVPAVEHIRNGWLLACCPASKRRRDGTPGKGPLYFGIPEPTPKALRAAAKADPMLGLGWLLPLYAVGDAGAAEVMHLMVFKQSQIPWSPRFAQLCQDTGTTSFFQPDRVPLKAIKRRGRVEVVPAVPVFFHR